jgi:hypothetical protein
MTVISSQKQDQFIELFREFAQSYPLTEDGQRHIINYAAGREIGQRNYEEIIDAADRGEEITDAVLLKLLPYADSANNRENGAWIHLARLLIQHLSLEGQAGDQRFFAFLFDMNQIFELYVARYLKESFAADPVLSLEIQPTIWLDTTQKERGRPDLVLRSNRQRALIMDTKYKRFDGAPAADDIHQMIAYCHSLNVARSLLIYADPRPPDYRRDFHGIHLHVLSLPLDGAISLLRQRSQNLVDQLRTLFPD